MNYTSLGNTDLEVSQIGLGTVEIGLPYGIGENTLPTDKEAERILKIAVDLGITYFDTARGYGVAEERIGKSGIARLPNVVIGTKCAQFLEQGEDPRGQELEKRIRQEVEESLRNLKVDSIQLLQLHGGSKEQIERGELVDILRRLREEGKVQNFGIATRGESAPLAAIDSGFFSTVQTAYSILDQRMSPKVLPYSLKQKIGVINRSVLLKGALTQAVWKLPPELDQLKENSAQAAVIAKELQEDLPTLAIRFAASNPAISSILIGTIEPKHLRTAIKATNKGPLEQGTIQQLELLAIKDEKLIDPANWPPVN
jgi:1-deoxyxylulose-5-phosphate synthase